MDISGSVADINRIFSDTNTVAAAGAVAALTLTQLLYKKPDLTVILNGALVGLVSIKAEPISPSLIQSIMIGAVGGIILLFAVPMLDRMNIDYVVDASSVQIFAGIWGTLAVYFTNSATTFSVQLTTTVIVGAFVTVTTN